MADRFSDREIRLIPMHYFYIGGDDRIFLNRIALDLRYENIRVQNVNLTLKETTKIYQNAYFNVGMRFHSVVLQTIASGKNYVLDYTEPKKGKIFGFLNDIDANGFFKSRYISLQNDQKALDIIKNTDAKFDFNSEYVNKKLNIYIYKLKELLE